MFTVTCERISRRMAYTVKFQYNEQFIASIKSLPDETRKWSPENMVWVITTASLLELIKSYRGNTKIHFDFGSEDSRKVFIDQIKRIEADELEKNKLINDLNANKERWLKYKLDLETSYVEHIEKVHEHLKEGIKLYPHQVVSTMFLNKTRNLLLALDMGTGKTIISIAYVEMNGFQKVVVITPNSLKFNYYNEVKKFTNSEAYIIGKKNTCTVEEAKYLIVNYEYFNSSNFSIIEKKFNALNIGKIDCLILDESHRIKSSDSNTYKNFKKLFKTDIFRDGNVSKVFMSGTPAPSKCAELYTVLNQISPLDFSTKKYFYEYYCGMNYNLDGYGWETDISMTKFDELFHKIAPYIYRKKKSDVLKDLPEKTYQKIVLEMNPKEYGIYYDLEEGVANEFVNKELNNALSIMGKLREYTSYLKVNSVGELIDSILESGEKFVAVDFYKNSLRELHKQYPEISGLHTGDEKDYERSEIVNDFQNEEGKIKIFLGSEGTTKEGLTLTAASKIGVLTIPWTPGTLDQITDRLARIGQKNAVNAYIFIYKDTIDEYVFDLIESKRAEIAQVIDGEKYESNVNQSIINDLIKIIKNKHKK
jgi:SWI/SNF-related matrix-associated actin-dependent regulator of chromatin subfamily A-like protein 1